MKELLITVYIILIVIYKRLCCFTGLKYFIHNSATESTIQKALDIMKCTEELIDEVKQCQTQICLHLLVCATNKVT